ncbi:MAG: DUF4198 domain-containing protein [Clostridiales bacterium]|nr:DUF4198 domain-containing protein [Clostridiales bacterium]
MKNHAKKLLCTALAVILLLALSACEAPQPPVQTPPEESGDVVIDPPADPAKTEEKDDDPPVTDEPVTSDPGPEEPVINDPDPSERIMQITSAPANVYRGEEVTITITGKPNTEYKITVTYRSGNASTAAGLVTKTSDADGNVSWTWRIGGNTGAGASKAEISGGGESLRHDFTVVVE